MPRVLWEGQEWVPEEERGSQVRLPGGGGILAVKEGNEWQVMGIFQGAVARVPGPHF